MALFLDQLLLLAPLFALVLLGWGLGRIRVVTERAARAAASLTFRLLMPALLFRHLAGLGAWPPVDWAVVPAFFGGSVLLFLLVRSFLLRRGRSATTSADATVAALAGVFPNNVQLGLPVLLLTLGDAFLPAYSVLVAGSVLIFWTLGVAFVEWGRAADGKDARSRRAVLGRIVRSFLGLLRNPIIGALLLGLLWNTAGWGLPGLFGEALALTAEVAAPVALLVVGLGLARTKVGVGSGNLLTVAATKLFLQPLLVGTLCWVFGVGATETTAALFMASLPCAVNVYLMASEFRAAEETVAKAILLTTSAALLWVPLVLTGLKVFG